MRLQSLSRQSAEPCSDSAAGQSAAYAILAAQCSAGGVSTAVVLGGHILPAPDTVPVADCCRVEVGCGILVAEAVRRDVVYSGEEALDYVIVGDHALVLNSGPRGVGSRMKVVYGRCQAIRSCRC